MGGISMNRRTFLKRVVSTAVFCAAGVSPARSKNQEKSPNIIFILTDDQGWTSVSYPADPQRLDSRSDYIETPQMARAARQGMRFTSGYAPNAQCSPTRHSILFGQNAARHIYGRDLHWTEKAPNWLTIPKALKTANPAYRTAHFGKWHVAVTPAEAGFDFSDGPTSNYEGDTQNGKHRDTKAVARNLSKYNKKHGIRPPKLNGNFSKLPVYYPDEDPKGAVSMTRRAGDFMRESLSAGKPFFAYIAHFATHLDLVLKRRATNTLKIRNRASNTTTPVSPPWPKTWTGPLAKHSIWSRNSAYRTIPIFSFMSDNGGVQHFAQSALVDSDGEIVETHETSVTWRNLPLRHGKHEYYEGGIRVPFLVLGPDVKPNSVSRVPVTGLDLLPTFVDLAGHQGDLPENIDGGSLVGLLRSGGVGEVRRRRDALIFHQGAKRVPISAIRKGDYKLVKHWLAEDEKTKGVKYRGDKLIELYDLSRDLSESEDLSLEMPERTKALHSELMNFLEDVGAETEYTKRWDAYNRMKKNRGLPSHGEIRLDYRSPFAGK